MTKLDDLYRLRALIATQIADEERARAQAEGLPPTDTALLIGAAADLYGVTVEEVLAGGQEPRVTRARQAACWLLRARGLSFPRIGSALGRDHTTVMHACNKIDADPAMRALLWSQLEEMAA